MDVLPRKPILWQYTSGKSGEYSHRWAPVTARQLDEIETLIFALLFFSSCKQRGEIAFKEWDKVLYGMAPPPYATGSLAHAFPCELFNFLPPMEAAERMSFEERIQQGFELALSDGLDVCLSLSSVTVAIGDRFSQKGRKPNLKTLLKRPKSLLRPTQGHTKVQLSRRAPYATTCLHDNEPNGDRMAQKGRKTTLKALAKRPKALLRLEKGLAKSKLARRPLMPKDLWTLK